MKGDVRVSLWSIPLRHLPFYYTSFLFIFLTMAVIELYPKIDEALQEESQSTAVAYAIETVDGKPDSEDEPPSSYFLYNSLITIFTIGKIVLTASENLISVTVVSVPFLILFTEAIGVIGVLGNAINERRKKRRQEQDRRTRSIVEEELRKLVDGTLESRLKEAVKEGIREGLRLERNRSRRRNRKDTGTSH